MILKPQNNMDNDIDPGYAIQNLSAILFSVISYDTNLIRTGTATVIIITSLGEA